MSEKIDKEIEAMKTILNCLEELEEDVRKSVIEYVLKRLNLTDDILISGNQNQKNQLHGNLSDFLAPENQSQMEGGSNIHIKEFMEQKKPKSAVEMTALIAYYLEHLAEPSARKGKIKATDLDTWFKISDFNVCIWG